jgi:hypothetical protein
VEATALVLAALLVVACVLFVARPFLRDQDNREPSPGSGGERLRLMEERDRALAALKELEFDHRTGKISDEDYRGLVAPLRHQAAEALRSLELEPAEERERPKADVHG